MIATEERPSADQGPVVVPAPAGERRLRRDAAANLVRLLAAAREAFAELGVDAPVEEVARRAGLGVGTLYRRFPTKEALLEAVTEEMFAEAVTAAEQARDLPPAEGLATWLQGNVRLQARFGLAASRLWTSRETSRGQAAIEPIVGDLLSRAQQAGAVRPEVTGTDLALVLWATGGLCETLARSGAPSEEAALRLLALLLDGLGRTPAEGGTPLPGSPLTFEQVKQGHAPA